MGSYYDDYFKEFGQPHECPICGKTFIPTPDWYWKIGDSGLNTRNKNVCSYSCMRKWEKELEAKAKQRREYARRAKEKRTY